MHYNVWLYKLADIVKVNDRYICLPKDEWIEEKFSSWNQVSVRHYNFKSLLSTVISEEKGSFELHIISIIISYIIIICFCFLSEQAYLLNSPNVVNCNDNLLSSDKSHSALRTTWRYTYNHHHY